MTRSISFEQPIKTRYLKIHPASAEIQPLQNPNLQHQSEPKNLNAMRSSINILKGDDGKPGPDGPMGSKGATVIILSWDIC